MPLHEPRARLISASSQQVPHGGLIDWHSISVLRWADGITQAHYNRLDLPTRRLVCENLHTPLAEAPGASWAILALLASAEELDARLRGDWGL